MTAVRSRAAGFTLVEVLAAILVLGFVIGMVSQGLRFGVLATRLVEGEHADNLLAVDQALRRLIRQADPGIYPEPASLQGTADRLAMTTGLPARGLEPPQRADVVLLASGERLVLRWRLHRHASEFGPGPGWTETVLLDQTERVDFAYFTASGWSATWSRDTLPVLIRLTVTFAADSRRRWPAIIVAPVREPLQE